tara:strand:- start:1297 stop:1776 length:480 start_codon:yes stop_codon:yes gene_type:complete
MYYNEVRQPDGTSVIGIDYTIERPNVLEVIPLSETQQQELEPEYQLFDSSVVSWLSICIVIMSIYYILEYDNSVSIINCLSCLLPLHSLQNNTVYGICAYTVYVMFAMVLTTLLNVYVYFWYYLGCFSIIICIFITSVAKYIKKINNQIQNQNINEHIV